MLRDEVFLTTKLWPSDYGMVSTLEAAEASMKRLNTDYLDLYLMHWPVRPPNKKEVLENTWRAMELLIDTEKCRAIGVSNFSQQDLEEIMEVGSIVPHVNQCEFHPYQNPKQLRQFCADSRIQFQVRYRNISCNSR